ncbi:MAG: hypothetical protein Q8O84_04185 [Nanoarchaeota archaeon]|nr:hypothetical protein [Nanoarchaeota archaeon]
MKDKIKSKEPMTIWIRGYDKSKFEESHLLRADRIEYLHDKEGECFDHHLFFYLKKELVFKVWLKNKPKDKEYKNIDEALKDVGIEVY